MPISSEIKNVLNNSVPKNQQTIIMHPLVDTNENNISNNIGDGTITQLPPQIQTQQQQKPMGPTNGSINGIVQTMSEKLVVRTNSKAQQTPTTAWAKKSTQSVAVSVVPSNNYPHNEVNAAKQNVLGSNNSSSCSNNNNIPIVPKVEEHQHQQQQPQQSSKVTAATIAAEKSVQSSHDITTTQQSSEVQTVPVSDMQPEEPTIFSNNNNNNNNR